MRLIDAEQFDFFGGSYKGYDRESYIAGAKAVLEKMDEAPTIDAQPVVHAYFKDEKIRPEVPTHYTGYCSNCGKFQISEVNYCCQCGAKMDGKEENHD